MEPLTLFTKDDDPVNINDVRKSLHQIDCNRNEPANCNLNAFIHNIIHDACVCSEKSSVLINYYRHMSARHVCSDEKKAAKNCVPSRDRT